MEVKLLWLTVVLLSSPLLTLCDPLYAFSAPNLLRVGSSENVFVEAQDYTGGPLNVKITVKNHPHKIIEMMSKQVTLTAENNYQILTDIKIPDDKNYFTDDPLKKQYVYLTAQFPGNLLEKVVMVSFQSGFIFVQTDKPIYTPASTVQYRIFSLTPNLTPLSQSGISVEIMNPHNITLDPVKIFPANGMKSGTYTIPEVASPGIWKVITRYANTPQKTFTAEFEVKEYVLPTFEVTLTPSESFFYVRAKSLTVDITANYLFGQKVEGYGFVVFGVMKDDSKTSIAASLQRVRINKGKSSAELTSDMILKTFPNIEQLVGHSIYVSVSVLTESGSEMVEAHRRGIQIVTSPYTIHFKRTPQYFKPGMPLDISVYVTNPDQTPAKNVEMEVNFGGDRYRTKSNGIAKATINSQEGSSTLEITVKTKDPMLSEEQQAVNKMTAQAYIPKGDSKNYLHIGIDAAELEIGGQMKVNLYTGNSPGAKNQDYTYMILSKGQIVQADRFKRKGQALVTLSLPVTKNMLPSFRFVAYYHVGSEVVSDSVWVDVKDTCMGTLKLEVKDKKIYYKPGDEFSLQITGDPGAKVGLVVVDKAVQVLNKNRLTQTKIWDIIEKHDTGCTAGSGKDSMGVFYDAGLMFESNSAGGTNTRTEHGCPTPPKRRRRAESLWQVTATLAGKYTGDLKVCCFDGMKENKLDYTCERRATYIVDGQECAKAFLHCCNEMKKRTATAGDEELLLARSEDDDDYYIESDYIVSRTQFPETWLWEEIDLPACKDKNCQTTSFTRNGIYLKESITTWQILAISLSQTNSICVAEPEEMITYKNFFIDLKMPYSAVRNEQVEIRAIIHNYNNEKMKVRVEFMETENVCSAASKKNKYRTVVEVQRQSTRAVSFVIIPMTVGNHVIEVKAAANDLLSTDGVKKTLKVVSEGVLVPLQIKNVELNPAKYGKDEEQHISVRTDIPEDWVPDTPASTHITVTGEEITQTVEQAISGDFMGRLIVQPHGCGEQTMIKMTLPLIATHYLDSTNQWEAVGMHRRDEAIKHINTGYQAELAYRKTDGSYAAWINRPSNTWLTAYVAKVFAMANNLIAIEENVICSALKWLVLNKQLPDGSFKEGTAVVHGEMVGDVRGNDADASLTAFVLIAMQEGVEICAQSVGSLHDSMRKAVNYLESRLPKMTNPYAVAMTSYAMANADKLNKDLLMKHSTKMKEGTAWNTNQKHHSLEATAYAVLALVRARDYDKAGEAVHWLARQQAQYGSSGTTQATIMVFQAVAEYRTQVKNPQNFDLDVELSVAGRSKPVKWSFRKDTMHVTRSDKVQMKNNFNVTAKGPGTATLSVFTLYYAKPVAKEADCKHFNLSVAMNPERNAKYQGAIESYKLVVDFFYKSQTNDATMTIVDIGLLTGYKVDEGDLEALATGKDRTIQKFEMDKELSERGSLIIYLDKVSHKEHERISFKIHKMNNVGLLQPAAVTVYEYYSPDARCTKFYHPEKKDGALTRLCLNKEICQCAEENCSYQKKNDVKEDLRSDKACEGGMDYVYKVKVVKMDLSQHSDIYKMKVEKVLKEGTEDGVEGQERDFLGHPNCRESLLLQEGKSYLIMGKSIDLPKLGGRIQYILGDQTWIEYWPTREESQTAQYRKSYIGINTLENKLQKEGCST
ncbi:complement C3-like [Xyrauchen texanus]|uniref:complement C3-like n=1 Tax=Xyrauchen texanus TaxID=154827 RepID=UPI002242C604|nr:complement C3-like [Xyrauchen texanus]